MTAQHAALIQHVGSFLDRTLVANKRDIPILVGVSGGVDSMVLLDLVRQYRGRTQQSIAVVHVNHGLRDAATEDEKLVRSVCERWQIPLHIRRVSAAERIHLPNGVEAAARAWRHEAFREIAKELNGTYVCLAHHADDQAETMLWRWLRGTSATGFSGMRGVQDIGGITLLRPLLRVDKQSLSVYAESQGIPYLIDETNATMIYTRNLIRHRLMPILKEIQPHLTAFTTRLTNVLQEEDAYLDKQAKLAFERLVRVESDGSYCISVSGFRLVPLALQRRVIQIILYCFAPADWTFQNIEQLVRLFASTNPSAELRLQGSILVTRKYDWVEVQRCPAGPARMQANAVKWTLSDDAVLRYAWSHTQEEWEFRCTRWQPTDAVRASSRAETRLSDVSSVVVGPLPSGTKMSLLGRAGSKKIQDVFTDAKVPKVWRKEWPGVFIDNHVVWLPGVARSQDALLTADSHSGWTITAKPPVKF